MVRCKMIQNKLTVVSGCSGIGGIDAGLKATGRFRTICYIEKEIFCNQVLLERMRDGRLDIAPIYKDFRRFEGRRWRGFVDLFIAGIPCQGHSMAGKRRGKHDERNLWPDMQRIIGEMEPRYFVVENVPGLFVGEQAYGYEILGHGQEIGYCTAKIHLAAKEVGARHRRDRVFIVGVRMADTELCGHIHNESEEQPTERGKYAQRDTITSSQDTTDTDIPPTEHKVQTGWDMFASSCEELSNPLRKRFQRKSREEKKFTRPESANGERRLYWETEPSICRVVDGISSRMDSYLWKERIKSLGNAVVPQVAEKIGELILRIDEKLKEKETD